MAKKLVVLYKERKRENKSKFQVRRGGVPPPPHLKRGDVRTITGWELSGAVRTKPSETSGGRYGSLGSRIDWLLLETTWIAVFLYLLLDFKFQIVLCKYSIHVTFLVK